MAIIINELLLQTFRDFPRCEWCGVEGRGTLQPHHVICRGMGSGSRLDIPENLFAVCWKDHDLIGRGKITYWQIIPIVAKRCGKGVDELREYVFELLRS